MAIGELGRERPDLKIIAISGSNMDDDLKWTGRLGVQRKFNKTFDISQMLAAVKELPTS